MHRLTRKIQKYSIQVTFYSCLVSTLIFGSISVTYAQAGSTQASAAANNTDSFAGIAELGEQIAIAQRKIQAMTLKNSLDALQAQQNIGTFPFKVLRIEGFGDNLYAILSDDSGIIYQVGPNDLIGNQYRISLIRPLSVAVVDINSNESYAVPFVVGGVNIDNNAITKSMAPALMTGSKN